MRCPRLSELPPPPPGKTGWPWTEESSQLPVFMPDGSTWPTISIVTPSYNQADFIEETIRSILLQGYPNLEYFISEDCSTDNTLEIVEPYMPWVEVLVAEQNGGMSSAINVGFRACSGDIITWISSDDVYQRGAFREVGLKKPYLSDYGVIVGGFRFMSEDSVLELKEHSPKLPHEGPIDLTLVSPERWRLHQVATFYIRHALDDVGRHVHEDIRHNPDRELLYRMCQKHRVLLIDGVLAAFRRHAHSKSWATSNMITMGREFGQIFHMFFTDDRRDNRKRRLIARYHYARGYLRAAVYGDNLLRSLWALLVAAYHRPALCFTRRYVLAWLKVLRLYDPLRRLIRAQSSDQAAS